MSAILDREMPEEKRKRRFIIWWWLAGALLLGGVSYYAYTQKMYENQTEKPSRPIAIEQKTLDNQSITPKSNKNIATDISVKKQDFTTQNTQVKPSQNTILKQKTIENSLLKEERNDIKLIVIDDKNNSNNSTTPPQLESENGKNIAENIRNSLITNSVNFADLKPIERTEEDILNIKPVDFEPIISKEDDVKRKLKIGITAGTHSHQLKKLDGYQFGFAAAYPLSKKWSLSAALGFRQTTAYGDSLNYIQAQRENTTGVSSSLNVVPGKTLKISQLHYIELPTELNFNINEKWSVFSGAKVGYLLNEKVTYDSTQAVFVVLDPSSLSSKYATTQDQSFAGSPSSKTLSLNKLSIALLGGVRYKVSEKLSFSLRYDYDVRSISKLSNRRFYNRFVGLNGVYYF
jgi:opacity protein-like surface antigen